MAVKPLRHMLVLLPGITGSVLQKDGAMCGRFRGGPGGARIRTLGGSLEVALERR
jgi:hypothetical protein